MIPQNVIDEILDKVSIIDVIGKYTEIKRSGRNALALCPFHQEKTPSFSISADKGLYHCFGCGVSGNTIGFLVDYQKMTFMEALTELAKMAGVDLEKYNDQEGYLPAKEKEVLFKINQESAQYFHKLLLTSPESGEARKYLKSRKITLETVKTYRLGFGGTGWNGLGSYLIDKGFPEQDILKAGVSSKGKQGIYDRFKDRIIFPIMDREGKPVGFGGRILTNDKKNAKYLNSAENTLFHKGSLLFSLNFAKDEIVKEKQAIIVEGYMDVIALYQHGIKGAVAPLGTALTENQLTIIKRFCDTVYFIFDGDSAGITAANRSLDIAVGSDLTQWVVILPDNKDPYDYVMEYGKDGFLKFIGEKRLAPIDFKIRYFSKKIDVKNDKLKFLLALFPYIARIKSPIIREGYVKKLAAFIEEDFAAVLSEYNHFIQKDNNFGRAFQKKATAGSNINKAEIDFITFFILFPEKSPEIASIIRDGMLQSPAITEVFSYIIHNPEKTPREIMNTVQIPEVIKEVSRLAQSDPVNPERLTELAYKIKYLYIKREMAKVTEMIRQCDLNNNNTDRIKLMAENTRLEKEEKAVKELWHSFESLE